MIRFPPIAAIKAETPAGIKQNRQPCRGTDQTGIATGLSASTGGANF
jgi:hypothetical protein